MELVRGVNLRAYLRDARPSLARILEIFTAAGHGLAAAHRAGVVHRDFKPDNVLVGHDGRVRVTDFGLALAAAAPEPELATPTGSQSGAVDRTDAGVVIGTPAYMAPEQHAGAHVDPRSDQFSFCVALYEALYGERPFAGRTREEVAESVQQGRIAPRPPESRVPGSLRAILLRGLAPDPAGRFLTMPALLRALGRDRGRAPRRGAMIAAVALALVLVAFGSDWIVRGRAAAATLASFAAARAQTSRLFELRTETFSATADLSFIMPILREVAAVQDQADFGLGAEADDRASLEELHHNLASADWVIWLRAAQDADVAVADYKGRLLYASAAPEVWGRDVLAVAPLRAVYATGSDEVRIAVVRGDDPSVVASGLLGGKPRAGLRLLFTRLTVLDGRPRALFAQLLTGERLLAEIAPGEGTQVSMVAPDGTAQGKVPPAVVSAGLAARDIGEVEVAGERWLVQRHPIASPGSDSPIAFFVLAHPAEMGLAGLFPGARIVLGGLAVLLAVGGLGAVALVRARDLSRREPASGR
jgi:Protein kinase domain